MTKGFDAEFTFKELSAKHFEDTDLERLRFEAVQVGSPCKKQGSHQLHRGPQLSQALVCKKKRKLSKIKHSKSSKHLAMLPVKRDKPVPVPCFTPIRPRLPYHVSVSPAPHTHSLRVLEETPPIPNSAPKEKVITQVALVTSPR